MYITLPSSAPSPSASNPRAAPLERSTKRVQPKRSEQTQSNRQRLASLDGAGNRAAGEDDRSKQRELDAVWVAVLDAQAAEDVQQTDSDACCNGGDGAGADVTCDSSAGGEGTDDKSGVRERLWVLSV